MKSQAIYISSIGSISPLGSSKEEIWNNYLTPTPFFTKNNYGWISKISAFSEEIIFEIRKHSKKYQSLDRTVLLSIFASRLALKESNWNSTNFGINIGSSRGATELFEYYYDSFLKEKNALTLSSPTTTLGNISSWVANDLKSEGIPISHSVTCSTALHSLLNGIAWINSGMSEYFLVGGSEAPLTSFTLAQMKALKIYSLKQEEFPCKSLDFNKKENSMILGEGAVSICLSKEEEKSLVKIEGFGYGNEDLDHNVSLSKDGICLQKSIKMALKNTSLEDVDAIIMHAPGTIKGDISELNAIKYIFKENIPPITSNKWKVGHTLGASGALSIEFALLMMENNHFIENPFYKNKFTPDKLNKILINAVGFGGNAVSILLSK